MYFRVRRNDSLPGESFNGPIVAEGSTKTTMLPRIGETIKHVDLGQFREGSARVTSNRVKVVDVEWVLLDRREECTVWVEAE